MENELIYCVNHLVVDKVRQILQKDHDGSFLNLNLLSNAISDEEFTDSIIDQRKDLFFILVDYERTFSKDFGSTMHGNLIQAARMKDIGALDVFLLSGCDLFYDVNEKETVYDVMMNDDGTSSDHDDYRRRQRIKELSDTYFPGIWNAVRTNDVVQTKRLINLWCSSDITMPQDSGNGHQSLATLARSTGNDIIIKLIDTTFHTLQLIHAVFAGNEDKVKLLLEEHKKLIQLDYRYSYSFGPPILSYAIKKNMVKIVKLLVENGAKIYSLMVPLSNELIGKVPILYAAISNPDLDMEMLQVLLPGKNFDEESKILHLMLFEKNNILEAAMRVYRLNLTCFKLLVEKCGALGISDRNGKCFTVRDVAVHHAPQFNDYIKIIDGYVIECIQNPDKYPNQRKILALHGYDLTQVSFQSVPTDPFLSLYGDYQSQIKTLFRAIENNDLKSFIELSSWKTRVEEGDKELFVTNLTWDSREVEGGKKMNPLPLLHRAVIFDRVDIVKKILEGKSYRDTPIDFLLDHHKRTALHYASALKSLSEVRDILREFGASDHVMDRDGRTPLNFLFIQDLPSAHKLIQRLRFVDLDNEEPDPWKEKEEELELDDDFEDGDEDSDDDDDDSGNGNKNGSTNGRKDSSCAIT